MKKYKAFTLIEMILVIGIIMILLSISGLNLNIRDRIESKNQLKEMALDMKFLKHYAQINNCETSIKIRKDGYSTNFGQKSKEVKFNNLVKVESTNLENIRFTKSGKPSFLNNINSSGTIEFSIESRYFYKMTIEPVTGKVNFYEVEK